MTKTKRLCCYFVCESEGKGWTERERERVIAFVKVGRLKHD